MKQQWIVEELDNDSKMSVYRETFENYDAAVDAYNNRKTVAVLNTVSLFKADNQRTLLEERTEKFFLKG
jgi:hypothetical protein